MHRVSVRGLTTRPWDVGREHGRFGLVRLSWLLADLASDVDPECVDHTASLRRSRSLVLDEGRDIGVGSDVGDDT